jgi:hypothetical protein
VNGIDVVSIGESIDWVDKLVAMSDMYSRDGSKRPFLRVCLDSMSGNPVENCCACDKCLRAIVTLLARSESPDAWGFRVPEPLHETVRKRLMGMSVPSYNLFHWQHLQEMVASTLGEVNGESRELLSWFSTWDLKGDVPAPNRRALPRWRRTLRRVFGRRFGP